MASAADGRAVVRYVDEGDEVCLEHHQNLGVSSGELVRVHEEYRLLATSGAWLCVTVDGGAGPVLLPEHPDMWAAETSPGIVDLDTGDGLPTDRRT